MRPEYFWRRKDSDVGGADNWQPEEKRNRLLTTIYLVDLPEGLSTTARFEGELDQSEYYAGSDYWDAYLSRRGELSVEAIPGVWWRGLNPFTLGVSATIDRQDSLTELPDDSDWQDVLDAADRSPWELQITSLRNEITYRPDPRWLITQVLSTTETQDFLREQSSSSTVEWSPRSPTRWTVRYQWTEQEYHDPATSDLAIHRPSAEWHQRWGGPWFTRCTLSGEVYDHETAGYREGSLRNYVSAVWRKVPRLGRLECREEVTVSAREYDSSGDITRTISNNIRGDWKPFREMFFRAEWRVTYLVNEVDSEVTHRVEVRMGIRL